MKIVLLAVGKTSTPWIEQGIAQFLKKLTHYAPFELQVIPDIRAAKNLTREQQKAREGEAILASVQPGDILALLDEKGKEYTSEQFATHLQEKMLSGAKRYILAIGGPYGFSQEVYTRASEQISLSRMTLTHEMVRLLAMEQIYRAQTILKGEPYHHS